MLSMSSFNHLVSVEVRCSVAPFAITRFALSNHTPSGDSLARILLSWSLLSISVSPVELQLTVIVLKDGS